MLRTILFDAVASSSNGFTLPSAAAALSLQQSSGFEVTAHGLVEAQRTNQQFLSTSAGILRQNKSPRTVPRPPRRRRANMVMEHGSLDILRSYTKRRDGFAACRRTRTEPGRRLLVELLEERRDLVRRDLLEEREHDGLTVLNELLGPEADAGEHREAAVVQLDDLLAEVLLGRELVLGPGREALDIRVPAGESTGESGARDHTATPLC